MANEWTNEEIKILRKYYRQKGAKYVAERLGRNHDTVMAKAAKLNVRYKGIRPWKAWEDNFLRRHYDDRKNVSIARTLKRSVPSITARAKKLNLSGARPSYWSEEDENILRTMYPDRRNSLASISRLINRSPYAILLKAQTLKLRRPQKDHMWTKEEHRYFVQHRKTKTYREIAQALGLTESAVGHHASRSGFQQRPAGRLWTDEEKEYVKQNYKVIPTKEIAAKLGRSVNAIIAMVCPLGVSARRPRPWSEEEKKYVRDNYGRISRNDIAARLGRTISAVSEAARKLKLVKPRLRSAAAKRRIASPTNNSGNPRS
jgi:hypothetical protein